MRIIYWSDGFWPNIGGVEVLSNEFLPAMQERGHEFSIVTSHLGQGLPDQSSYKGSALHRFHFHRALETKDLKELKIISDRIKEIKRSFLPDLIHMNFSGISPFFHQLSRIPNEPPTLTTIHALPGPLVSRQSVLMKQILMTSEWVTAVSSAMLEDAISFVPEITQKSSIIYNSLREPALQPAKLDFEQPQLLCLGRLSNEKGFDIALRAFSEVVREFPMAHLVIAGDGPEKTILEELSLTLGLHDRVTFVGWVTPEKTRELMNESCMVIAPSRWREPFCLVALEASQMGRPVIASRTGALPEVVLHGETGLLFENENSASLAASINHLLEKPALAETLGVRGRQRAHQLFAWERFVDSYDSLYRRILSGSAVMQDD